MGREEQELVPESKRLLWSPFCLRAFARVFGESLQPSLLLAHPFFFPLRSLSEFTITSSVAPVSARMAIQRVA